jgi:metallophosphoesterase superfamily enzyme
MEAQTMRILGEWWLTPERVAIHEASATAVVADLHLGYAEVRRGRGEAVPCRSLAEQLLPLERALRRHGIARLVLGGDVLESGYQGKPLAQLLGWLEARSITLAGMVPGNHDRQAFRPGRGEFPVCREGCVLGRWLVVHGDETKPAGAVLQGHEHPWVRWSRHLSAPCYLAREGHVIVPAYSPDAAGVNVLGQGRWADYRAYVIAGEKILDFGEVGQLQNQKGRQKKRQRLTAENAALGRGGFKDLGPDSSQ